MSFLRRVALVATVLCVAACFDIAPTADGKVVRVNRLTGDLVLIENARYRPIEPQPEDAGSQGGSTASRRRPVSRARTWPRDSIPQIGARSIVLSTRCRSGRVDYHVTIEPVPRRYDYSGAAPFLFHMEDADGFQLVNESIARVEVTQVVDGSGRATGLTIAGAATLSAEECAELATWGLSWRF